MANFQLSYVRYFDTPRQTELLRGQAARLTVHVSKQLKYDQIMGKVTH